MIVCCYKVVLWEKLLVAELYFRFRFWLLLLFELRGYCLSYMHLTYKILVLIELILQIITRLAHDTFTSGDQRPPQNPILTLWLDLISGRSIRRATIISTTFLDGVDIIDNLMFGDNRFERSIIYLSATHLWHVWLLTLIFVMNLR